MIWLEDTSVDMLTWFKTMRWKQILINTIYLCAKTGLCDIQGSRKQTLLGVLFDNKLTFDKHIDNSSAKAFQKLRSANKMSSVILHEYW